MTKQEARQALEDWLLEKVKAGDGRLPAYDERVSCEFHEETQTFETWTFRGLVKLAYDLDDKK